MPQTLISVLFTIVIVLLVWKLFRKLIGAVALGVVLLVVLYLLGFV